MFFDQVHKGFKNPRPNLDSLCCCSATTANLFLRHFVFSPHKLSCCFVPFKAVLDIFIHETFLFLGGFGLVKTPIPGVEAVVKFFFSSFVVGGYSQQIRRLLYLFVFSFLAFVETHLPRDFLVFYLWTCFMENSCSISPSLLLLVCSW